MARRQSKHLRAPRPLLSVTPSRVRKRDGEWIVANVTANRAVKDYTCPWCHRPVVAGSAHIVAWPAEPHWGLERAVDARRHYHSSCWGQQP